MVWELLPYQVDIWIGAVGAGARSEELTDFVATGLACELELSVGGIWQWRMRHMDRPLAARLAAGEPWPRDLWPAEWSAIEHPDKAIVLVVAIDRPPWIRLLAQELDIRSQSWGPQVVREVAAWHLLPQVAREAVWEAFCPVARLHVLDLETREIELRARAAALAPRDETIELARQGEVYRMFVRYNDRSGRATRIVEVPFSYVLVENVDDTFLIGRLVTGLRSPISARRRGRTEQLFVVTKPWLAETRLSLRDRHQPHRPLAAYSIFSQSPTGGELTFIGRTDAAGTIVIPWHSGPLQVLWVKNGQVPLARLPVVPGSVPELVAELPSDDERLEAEGILVGVQEELLEVVVRRHILLGRIERLLRQGRRDEARQLYEELRSLRSRDDLRRYLLLQRKRLVAKDPANQKRIDLMFAKTEELLNAYLDPRPIDDLASKLR